MAKVIVVTSGKGGVGKTTSTAALGAAIAQTGQSVVVVDFDVGLRNLDLVMGAERRVVYDLINVVQGTIKLSQALIRDKRVETLYLLPASQTRDKDALTEDGVARVIGELREKLSAGRRLPCGTRTRRSSLPIRKSLRCAIPTASSAFSIPRPRRPRRANRCPSIC
jgi:septum site-determining protein MinD